jgi:hypothetical protein
MWQYKGMAVSTRRLVGSEWTASCSWRAGSHCTLHGDHRLAMVLEHGNNQGFLPHCAYQDVGSFCTICVAKTRAGCVATENHM